MNPTEVGEYLAWRWHHNSLILINAASNGPIFFAMGRRSLHLQFHSNFWWNLAALPIIIPPDTPSAKDKCVLPLSASQMQWHKINRFPRIKVMWETNLRRQKLQPVWRKYDPEYIKYGFVRAGSAFEPESSVLNVVKCCQKPCLFLLLIFVLLFSFHLSGKVVLRNVLTHRP